MSRLPGSWPRPAVPVSMGYCVGLRWFVCTVQVFQVSCKKAREPRPVEGDRRARGGEGQPHHREGGKTLGLSCRRNAAVPRAAPRAALGRAAILSHVDDPVLPLCRPMYLYLVSLYHMTTNRLVLRMPLQDTPSHRRSSGVAVAHARRLLERRVSRLPGSWPRPAVPVSMGYCVGLRWFVCTVQVFQVSCKKSPKLYNTRPTNKPAEQRIRGCATVGARYSCVIHVQRCAVWIWNGETRCVFLRLYV